MIRFKHNIQSANQKTNKGFSLIELLVVVAIIGILAAVGIVAYSGYTASARVNTVKQNLSTAIKYIENEKAKCDLGETTVMGTLPCASLRSGNAGIILAQHIFLRIQNLLPRHIDVYDTSPPIDHFFAWGGGVQWVQGRAFASGSGNQVQINTCLADPCTGDNRIQTFIQAN